MNFKQLFQQNAGLIGMLSSEAPIYTKATNMAGKNANSANLPSNYPSTGMIHIGQSTHYMVLMETKTNSRLPVKDYAPMQLDFISVANWKMRTSGLNGYNYEILHDPTAMSDSECKDLLLKFVDNAETFMKPAYYEAFSKKINALRVALGLEAKKEADNKSELEKVTDMLAQAIKKSISSDETDETDDEKPAPKKRVGKKAAETTPNEDTTI